MKLEHGAGYIKNKLPLPEGLLDDNFILYQYIQTTKEEEIYLDHNQRESR